MKTNTIRIVTFFCMPFIPMLTILASDNLLLLFQQSKGILF